MERSAGLTYVLLTVFACSPPPSGRDAGADAGVDAGEESDAGPDAGVDAGPRPCDGCMMEDGGCQPLLRTNVLHCGRDGMACAACEVGDLCIDGACVTSGPVLKVGDACVSDQRCRRDLGPNAWCKQATSTDGGLYVGGYCTLPCATTQCPIGASCSSGLASYGEEDVLCLDNCRFNDRCRFNDYACYPRSDGGGVCWLASLPPFTGQSATAIGDACALDSDCGAGAACELTADAGQCIRLNCLSDSECSADAGAACVEGSCRRRCTVSQSTCAVGFTCVTDDGGVTGLCRAP